MTNDEKAQRSETGSSPRSLIEGFGFRFAVGFLVTAFMRQQVAGTEAFQKAMTLFLAALIVHDLASAIPYMGTRRSRCLSATGLPCGASGRYLWRSSARW